MNNTCKHLLIGLFAMGRPIPKWKKSATSIGPGRATCTATVTQASTTDPFHYSVKFTIQ